MTVELRPHQTEAIEELRESLRRHRSVLLRAPTGFGKTLTAAFMIGSAAAKGKRVLFTVHRQELIEQSMEAFDNVGIRYGIIAAGFTPNPSHVVQIASIDTLRMRLDKIQSPDLLVIDECHHAAAKSWLKTINHFGQAKVVGLSATPRRTSGEGLDHIFQDMVHGKDVGWLIDNKFLSPYRAFAPPPPDLSGLHTRMGDFVQSESEELMDKPKIVGDAVAHYLQLCRDKRAVVFAVSVKHSTHIAQAFRYNGVMALHIDGEMDKTERKKAIQAFRDDHVKVITNCNLISEGFDLPAMDAAILMRPTQSLSLHLQQVGRCLRYCEGKTAIILDHAGNVMRHGLPDDDFEWTLKGRDKKAKKNDEEQSEKIKQCPQCFFVHRPALACPSCGHVYEVKAREPEQVDGQLQEILKTKAEREADALKKKEWNKKLRKCKTKGELMTLAMINKFKNPEAFADKILETRRRWAMTI